MSLVAQGRGVSRGTLECLGVVGSRCLGSSGHDLLSPLFRFPFPATAPIPSGGWRCPMRCAR